jgi:hypothetical protein
VRRYIPPAARRRRTVVSRPSLTRWNRRCQHCATKFRIAHPVPKAGFPSDPFRDRCSVLNKPSSSRSYSFESRVKVSDPAPDGCGRNASETVTKPPGPTVRSSNQRELGCCQREVHVGISVSGSLGGSASLSASRKSTRSCLSDKTLLAVDVAPPSLWGRVVGTGAECRLSSLCSPNPFAWLSWAGLRWAREEDGMLFLRRQWLLDAVLRIEVELPC